MPERELFKSTRASRHAPAHAKSAHKTPCARLPHRPVPGTPSALDQARLGLRLTFVGRGPLIGAWAALTAGGVLLPPPLAQPIALFSMAWLTLYGLVRGLDGGGTSVASWDANGGPSAARVAGTMATDLLVMATAAGLLSIGADIPHAMVTFALAAGLALYGLGSATRGDAPTFGGRLRRLAALCAILGLGPVAALLLSRVALVDATTVVIAIPAGVGLVGRLVMARARREPGAGRRGGVPVWLLAGGLGVASVGTGLLAGPPPSAELDASGTLLVPKTDPRTPQWLWLVDDGNAPRRLDLRGPFLIAQRHDTGAIAYQHEPDLLAAHSTPTAGLSLPNGTRIECVWDTYATYTWFDVDGRGVTLADYSGALWRIDEDTCGPTDQPPSGLPQELAADRYTATEDWRTPLQAGVPIRLFNDR